MALGTGVLARTTSVLGTHMLSRVSTTNVSTPMPVFGVDVAWLTAPSSATPTWSSITEHVRSITIHRGRQHELDRMEAGTATIVLDNRGRHYDPTNSSGTYYGYILPMRRIRVTATWKNTSYNLFHGYIEGWPQTWAERNDATVTITATDGFKVLALCKLNTSYSSELTSVRVANVLNSVGWPTADRTIATGLSTLQAATPDNEPALSHLHDVVNSENGRHFIGANGYYVFHSRLTIGTTPYSVSQVTFSDADTSVLPYLDLTMDYDDTQIWNDVRVTRTGGTEQTASDATSQANYYIRTLVRSSLVTTDGEAESAASYLCQRYKDPVLRMYGLQVTGGGHEPVYAQMLGRELGDRITIVRTPPAGGVAVTTEQIIEQIQHTIRPGYFESKYELSPADASALSLYDDPGAIFDTSEWGY